MKKYIKPGLITVLLIYLFLKPNLPSDEEMIAHFYKNKADIEELVKQWRTHEDFLSVSAWKKSESTIHGLMWKEFLHIPQVPRIENNYLIGPMNHDGKYLFEKRVLSSLNTAPFFW